MGQPELQAAKIYPNHPLLAGTPLPTTWTYAVDPQYAAMGYDPNVLAAYGYGMGYGGVSQAAWDLGLKKRACDQCNHSKVRCDFGDPCGECSTSRLTSAHSQSGV